MSRFLANDIGSFRTISFCLFQVKYEEKSPPIKGSA